jgi:hypothetical protein
MSDKEFIGGCQNIGRSVVDDIEVTRRGSNLRRDTMRYTMVVGRRSYE